MTTDNNAGIALSTLQSVTLLPRTCYGCTSASGPAPRLSTIGGRSGKR